MRYNGTTRQVRAVYKRPRPYVPGSVDIGMRFVLAQDTPKLSLGLATILLAVSAFSTRAAGVTWIDGNQSNGRNLGFGVYHSVHFKDKRKAVG